MLAIALIIGIGTGVYAWLGSTAEWRRRSNDASYSLLHMYDLRVTTAEGVDAPAGQMLSVLATLPDPGIVATAEERLVAASQVDASTSGESILVPGRIVGMDLTDGGPHVNGVLVPDGDGRALTEADDGRAPDMAHGAPAVRPGHIGEAGMPRIFARCIGRSRDAEARSGRPPGVPSFRVGHHRVRRAAALDLHRGGRGGPTPGRRRHGRPGRRPSGSCIIRMPERTRRQAGVPWRRASANRIPRLLRRLGGHARLRQAGVERDPRERWRRSFAGNTDDRKRRRTGIEKRLRA